MMLTDYNEEETMNSFYAEGREDGRAEERNELIFKMQSLGYSRTAIDQILN